MNHDRIDDMIARAVLGELSDAELAELDAALDDDPEALAELDAELETAASIQSIAAEAPPATLKASVMAAIASTAQDGHIGRPSDTTTPQQDAPPVHGATVTSLAAVRRTRIRQTLLAAAAVITLVVGGAFVAGNRTGGPSSFDAVATAPDAELRSLDGSLTGSLRVIFSPREQAIVVDGANLPALAENQTYQLWFVSSDGVAKSAGLFRPSDDGRVMERFDDLDPTGFVVGVTVEPAGGSESPTLPIVASA